MGAREIPDDITRASALVDALFVEFMRPPANLTVSQWADRKRVLSSKSASEPGQWRTDRNPLLRVDREVLSALQRWASDDLRSLNGQIEWLLREALRQSKRLPKDR